MDTSYLTKQVATIIGQLHSLFEEIGVPTHERESRESEVRVSVQINKVLWLTKYSYSRRSPRPYTIKFVRSQRMIMASLVVYCH
jgi:hypothetical protein